MAAQPPLSEVNLSVGRPVRRVNDRLMTLIMAGLLFVVGAVSLARTSNTIEAVPSPAGVMVASRQLQFADFPGGRVVITDPKTERHLRTLEAGEGSFIRGVVRSFARTRQQRSVTIDAPLQLSQYDDHRLIISDPMTGQEIELGAFGATNAGEFSTLLMTPAPMLSVDRH